MRKEDLYIIQNGDTGQRMAEGLKGNFDTIVDGINNLPDGEDISLEQNKMKFADRAYNPSEFSGKGYKILRKNIVDGKNVLTQEMINQENTVYEIRYDFDLDGVTINIPLNSDILFNGGKFKNGIIRGNNTFIINDDYYIFDNVEVRNNINGNSYSNQKINAKAFGVIANDFNIDNAEIINYALNNCSIRILEIPAGEYYIKQPIRIPVNKKIIGAGCEPYPSLATIISPSIDFKTLFPNRGLIETLNFDFPNGMTSQNPDYSHWTQIYDLRLNVGNIDGVTYDYDFGIAFWSAGEQSEINNVSIYNATKAGFFIGGDPEVLSIFTCSAWNTKGILQEDGNYTWGYGMMFDNHPNINFAPNSSTAAGGRSSTGNCRIFGFSGDGNKNGHIYANGTQIIQCIGLKSEQNRYCLVSSNKYHDARETTQTWIVTGSSAKDPQVTDENNSFFRVINETENSNPQNNIKLFINMVGGMTYQYINEITKENILCRNHECFLIKAGDADAIHIIGSKINTPGVIETTNNGGVTEVRHTMTYINPITNIPSPSYEIKSFNGLDTLSLGGRYIDEKLISNILLKTVTGETKYVDLLFPLNDENKQPATAIRLEKDSISICPDSSYKMGFFGKKVNQQIINTPVSDNIYDFIVKLSSYGLFNISGITKLLSKGTFSQKPTSSQGVQQGFAYFCTDKQTTEGATNGIMIYYKGEDVWVDALGRVVE